MASTPSGNWFLDSLSAGSAGRLMESARVVDLPHGTPLFGVGDDPNFVYFLTSGIASIVFTSERGMSIELATLGKEGVVGAMAVLGDLQGIGSCQMQVAGAGYRMPLKAFQEAFQDSVEIRQRLLDFVQQQANTGFQLVACNRLHLTQARFARWLLMVQDRIESDVLPMTQEFLACMLGTQRTTVAEVAGELQRMGAIEYRRGLIRMVDRTKLEQVTCECYPLLRERFQRLYKMPVSLS